MYELLKFTTKVVNSDETNIICTNGDKYIRISVNNFDKICRSCLFGSAEKDLFECEHEGIPLNKIYTSVYSIKIEKNDGLPNNICDKCLEIVIEFNTYKLSVLKSEDILKNVLTKYVEHTENKVSLDEKNISDSEDDNYDHPLDKNIKEDKTKSEVQKKFKCKYCKTSFEKFSDHKRHMKLEKEKRKDIFVPCNICEKLFTKKKLATHLKIHTKSKINFKCEACGKNYSTRRNLRRHYLSHTGLPHICEICGKGFREPHLLKEHLNIHNGINPYLCSLCGKSYPTSSALRLHRRYTHEGKKPKVYKYPKKPGDVPKPKPPRGSFPCEICGKVYASRTIVNYHVLTHSEEKNFQCNDCGKMFANKSILGDHRRVHRLSYKCTYCERAFAYAASLETHINSHTGEKPHACSVCGKRYSNRSHMREHMRTHTGERPYSCYVCGKTFAVRGNLNGHLKTHARDNPFNCDVCQKRFLDKASFKKHLAEHESKSSLVKLEGSV